jgi:hypothetical protein
MTGQGIQHHWQGIGDVGGRRVGVAVSFAVSLHFMRQHIRLRFVPMCLSCSPALSHQSFPHTPCPQYRAMSTFLQLNHGNVDPRQDF